MYEGPFTLPREKTNTCPFEFTATPATSPKLMSGGILSGSGTDSNGIVGTLGCCARVGSESAVNSNNTATNLLFTRPSNHESGVMDALSANIPPYLRVKL